MMARRWNLLRNGRQVDNRLGLAVQNGKTLYDLALHHSRPGFALSIREGRHHILRLLVCCKN